MRVAITEHTRVHDVTLALSSAFPVWPGDPPIAISPWTRIAEGASANVTRISFPSHCGTHVDPPRHSFDNGAALDRIPIERWIGRCQVVQIDDSVDQIEPDHLESAGIDRSTTRLLLGTRNSANWQREPVTFATDYVALTRSAAHWVVDRGIKLIGIDALSFELFDDGEGIVHRTILGNDCVAIEGLDLTGIAPGFYDLICLPLKLRDGDGAPARVILLEDHAPS